MHSYILARMGDDHKKQVRRLRSLELLVQLFPSEDQLGGPAVGAMVRIEHRMPLLQEGRDLRRREPVAGLDRRLAGHRVQHVVQQVAAVGLPAAGNQPFQQGARSTSPGFMFASIAGKPVISTVSPPKGSIRRPSWLSTPRCSRAMAASAGLKIDRFGHQQVLRLQRPGVDPRADLLEQYPLVQGVLVDDRHAFLRFRD